MIMPDHWEPFVHEIEHAPTDQHRLEASERFADFLETEGYPAHAETIRLHNSQAMASKLYWHPGGMVVPDSDYNRRVTTGVGQNYDTGKRHLFLWMPLTKGVGTPKGHVAFFPKMPNELVDKLYDALQAEGAEEV